MRIADTDVMEAVTLTPDQSEFVLDLDLSGASVRGRQRWPALCAAGHCHAGAQPRRPEVTMTQPDGAFRFVDLPAGTYSARVHPRGSRVDNIMLDGQNEQRIDLMLAGWGYVVQVDAAARPSAADELDGRPQRTPKQTRVRCAVAGYKSLAVYAYSGEWRSQRVETGSALALGEFACEMDVSGCPADECTVAVQGVVDEEGEPVALTAYVPLHQPSIPFVRFTRQQISERGRAAQSAIAGQVVGEMDSGQLVTVVLTDEQGNRHQQRVTKGGAFEFDYLEAGLYAVAVLGHETTTQRVDLALDGQNRVTVELRLPRPAPEPSHVVADGSGVIVGIIPNGAGKVAWLVDSLGNEHSAELDADDQVRFDQLPAGVYTLNVEGGYKEANLRIQGDKGVEIYFAPLVTEWRAEVSTAGSMPGFSAIRVEVAEQYDLPVYLSKEEWDGMVALTGSKRELGRFALEFSPLEPGYYIVEPAGLNVLAEVQLTGLEAVWVSFRQHTAPIRPNGVVPLGTARRWGRQEERAE
ncbi:MAG: carboxypeptidase-like regulatory domain-containing protein, partial [Caldilineaceae bacterium]